MLLAVSQCDLNPWKLPVDGESLEPATAAISWGDLAELQATCVLGFSWNLRVFTS